MRKEDTNMAVVVSVTGANPPSKMAQLAIETADFTQLVKACGYVQVIPGQDGDYKALYHNGIEYTFGDLKSMPENATRVFTYIQTNIFDKNFLLRELYEPMVRKLGARYGLSFKEDK